MQRLPPPHPSLPAVPHPPFPQHQSFYSSHYAQAYSQSYAQAYPAHNPVPYIFSLNSAGLPPSRPSPVWYQPGSCRCTSKGCSFIGSNKALETHMMDRHLIYPSGWEKRQKKQEWDADPSLKGKPIPIQGTNLSLDKPEDLEAWLAERKRRWPTAPRVEEKKRKMTEAIACGQLPDVMGFRGNKRQKMDARGDSRSSGKRGRGRGNSSRTRATDSGWNGRNGQITAPAEGSQVVAPSPVIRVPAPESTDTEDHNDSPEVISSKAPVAYVPPDTDPTPVSCTTHTSERKRAPNPNRQYKRPPTQPRKVPHNPFASRPTLLRNLLLPEIRVTISNLSQAIRFLVDNDFLEDVEATPGDAESKLIQVIADCSAATRDIAPSIE